MDRAREEEWLQMRKKKEILEHIDEDNKEFLKLKEDLLKIMSRYPYLGYEEILGMVEPDVELINKMIDDDRRLKEMVMRL